MQSHALWPVSDRATTPDRRSPGSRRAPVVFTAKNAKTHESLFQKDHWERRLEKWSATHISSRALRLRGVIAPRNRRVVANHNRVFFVATKFLRQKPTRPRSLS